MQLFDDNSVFTRNVGLMATDLDSESIVLHVKSGKIFGMAETGKRIWDLLSEPLTFAVLTQKLVAEYDIDPEACANDVSDYLTELVKAGVVDVSTPQPAGQEN